MPKSKTASKTTEARRSKVRTLSAPTAGAPPKMTQTQYLTRMIRRTMSEVNTKIAQLEGRITTLSSTGSSSGSNVEVGVTDLQVPVQCGTVPGPSTSYYYPMARMPAEKPKFPARNKHPVTFIEDLTAYLKRCATGTDEVIDSIIECLEGDSRNWARIYKDRWTHFEDFKRDFLDTYWGEAEQNELRRKIVLNSWDDTQSTMLGHFITLCGQAKMLNYVIQEKQLVNDIMNHFPKDVQYAWTTSNYSSILQATEFLRKLDIVNKQTSLKGNSSVRPNFVQKPAAVAQNQHEKKNTFNRNQPFHNRSARQAASNKPAEANVVNIVDDNNSSNVDSVGTDNLN